MPGPSTLEILTPGGGETLELSAAEVRLSIADLLRRRDVPLNTRCGERGLCDGCLVELLSGRLRRQADDAVVEAGDEPVLLRGCEHRPEPHQPACLRLPARSLLAHRPQVVDEFKLAVPAAHDPLREPGDARPLGIAIDIGTTTVAVMVVNLEDGQILSRASAFNQQLKYGDNVLTRINRCQTDPASVGVLQDAICRGTLQPLVQEALAKAGQTTDAVACATVAGNTTMLHLFAGVDPSSMGMAPFTPTFLEHRLESGELLGLPADSTVHLLPSAAAYIGADLTAGALATGLIYDAGPSLLVDVGTNGEILFKHGDRLLGCATAAGPAFEGAGLACGLRAGEGAISHLGLGRDPFAVKLDVIGAGTPSTRVLAAGVCGSAYIDFLSEGRRIGLLTPTGRFAHDNLDGVADHLTKFNDYGRALRIATGQGRREIVIAEIDVAALMQAKAAIAAGIRTLMEQVGVAAVTEDGSTSPAGSGCTCGLPNAIGAGLVAERPAGAGRMVGNTSLGRRIPGAGWTAPRCRISKVREQMELIELNLDPNFEMNYIEELLLP